MRRRKVFCRVSRIGSESTAAFSYSSRTVFLLGEHQCKRFVSMWRQDEVWKMLLSFHWGYVFGSGKLSNNFSLKRKSCFYYDTKTI